MFKKLRPWWSVLFGKVPDAPSQVDSASQREFSERLRKELAANHKIHEFAQKEMLKLLDEDLRSLAGEIPYGMTGHDALGKTQQMRNQKKISELLRSIQTTLQKAE